MVYIKLKAEQNIPCTC